jgi:NAD(P)-dependent dehydrogenase (short-subunit alcohol dehydrogenase family)
MSQVALLTGATGNIGQAVAKGLIERGWTLIGVSRSAEKARELEQKTGATGVVGDLAAEGGIETLVETLAQKGIYPHAVLNFARGLDYLKMDDHGRPSSEDWGRAFDLEVRVPFELSMALVLTEGSRVESVIHASSMYGMSAFNPALYENPVKSSPIHYAVTKAAVIHLTHEMAVRLAPRGVRVNCISYGGVEGRVDEAFKARYAKLCPQGRMLNEADLAGPAVFLASSESSGMTGHNLAVDGGWSIW